MSPLSMERVVMSARDSSAEICRDVADDVLLLLMPLAMLTRLLDDE